MFFDHFALGDVHHPVGCCADSQTKWWSTVHGNFSIDNGKSQELIQLSIWTLQTNLCLKIIFSLGGSCTGLWIWGQ